MKTGNDIVKLLEPHDWEKRPPAPGEEMELMKSKFGISLPADFEDLLHYSNGGSLHGFKTPFIIYTTKETLALYKEHDLYEDISQTLIFGGDGGGIIFCYDLRSKNKSGGYNVMALYERTGSYDDAIYRCGSLHELITGIINNLKM